MTPHLVRVMTADMTPHVVRVMTMDITPDFSSDFWQQEVSGHMLVTLAAFGLVVSSFFTATAIAAAGVNVEVALAQQASEVAQTASVANAMPVPPSMMDTNMSASSTNMFCPQLARTIGRGSDDFATSTDVTQLQEFIAAHFGLAASTTVSGHFGPVTQALLERFQVEQGIATATQAGPLTRAAIARVCGGQNGNGQNSNGGPGNTQGNNQGKGQGMGQGSSTLPMMGSTTLSMLPHHDDHPMPVGSTTNTMASGTPMINRDGDHRGPPPTTSSAVPVSITDNSSNTASLVEAVNEIGDGYSHLLQASLGMFGL